MPISAMQRIEAFESAHVVCIGDVMLDRFVYGDVSRISPEAPIPVMKREREMCMLGGAGNVARNIVSLGASCHFISLVGADAAGAAISALCGELGRLTTDMIVDSARCSTEKTRFICGNQQLLRCDDEETTPISQSCEQQLLTALEAALSHPQARVLVLSDYAKGVLTSNVVQCAIAMAKAKNILVLVDPKHADMGFYAGADVLSPNFKEMKAFAGDDNPLLAAESLRATNNIGALVITRGKDGISLLEAGRPAQHFAAQARAVYDVSGAGDTVMAMLAVASGAGADLPQACELANVAAGIAVSRAGTATVYRTDMKAALHHKAMIDSASKLVSAQMAQAMVASWQEEGLRVGFTNGCFDLLHVGHLQSLTEAKSYCDKLVVAINADASVKRLKGESRPINTEMDRADLLGGMAPVDLVVIFREDTPEALLHLLRPDVLMKGADYTIDAVVGGDFVRSYGGEVKLLSIKQGHSSSALIAKTSAIV